MKKNYFNLEAIITFLSKFSKVIGLLLFSLFSNVAMAQTASATWTLTANSNSTNVGNVVGTAIGVGSNINSPTYSAGSGISTGGWFNDATSMQNNEYYEFKVTPNTNTVFNVTAINFQHSISSGNWLVRAYYSTDNFVNSTAIGAAFSSSSTSPTSNNNTVNLIVENKTLSVRIYGWESDGSGRSLRLRNVVVSGTTCTSGYWTGSSNSTWNNTANWCSGTIPTATTDVVIPSGVTNMPNISSTTNAVAKSVVINSGATLTLTSDALTLLNIKGDFTNNGTLTAGANSIVTFDGATASLVQGSSTSTFGNLTINKSAAATTINSSSKAFAVTNDLNVTQGNLVLTASDTDYIVGNNLTVANTSTLTHTVEWDTYGKLLLVSGNLDISGVYSYGGAPHRSHIQMNGINKTIRTGTSALSVLTLTNPSGSITANGNLTVNDNFWPSYGTAGTFTTGTNTITANAALLNSGGTFLLNGGTLNVSGGLYVGFQNNDAILNFTSGTINADFLNVGYDSGQGPRKGIFNHSGGTLNLSSSLSINATGASAYVCTGAPIVNLSGNWTNNSVFTADNSTVNFRGIAQALSGATTFYNLALSGSGTKTLNNTTTISNNLSIGSGVVAKLSTGLIHSAKGLILGGITTASGSWGSTTSSATHKNNTYFAADSGIVNITATSCTAGYWTGVTSTDWNTASNWCNGSVPSATTNVTIPAGVANMPIIAAGTTAVVKDLIINSLATLSLANSATSLLNISGNFINSGTFTAGALSTTSFVGAAQTVAGVTYGNLTLTGSGVKTLGAISVSSNLTTSGTATATTIADLAIGGNLVVGTGTIFTTGNNFALGVAGSTGITGILTLGGTGVKIFTGNVIVNTGGTWNNNGNSNVNLRGGITNNQTFTAGTGVYTFDTNAQSLSGNLTIGNVIVNSIALTNTGNLYISTALSGSGSLANALPPSTTLVIQGTCSITTLDNKATAIIDTGSGAISATTFTNTGTLHLNGSGSITTITNNIGGLINLNSSGTITTLNNATATSVLNINALTVPVITTLTATTAGNTVNYSGAGDQTIKSATYSNLNLSNSGTKIASGDLTVNSTLTSVAGVILNMGTNQLLGTLGTIANSGTIRTQNTSATPVPNGKNWGGTVQYDGAGQTVSSGNYTNLILSGSTTKTFIATTAISGNLSIAAGVVAKLSTGLIHTAGTLTLGGGATASGSWGSTASTATYKSDTYFAADTGKINVSTGSCTGNLISNGDFNSSTTNWTKASTKGTKSETNSENTYFATTNNNITAELDVEASLKQTVTVVPGVSYTVSFLYARRPGAPTTTGVTVKIIGGTTVTSPDLTTTSTTPQIGSFTFTPTSATIDVEFYNTIDGGSTLGTIIDDIVLIPSSLVAPVATTTTPVSVFHTSTSCAGVVVNLDVNNVTASGVTYAWTGTGGAVFSNASIKNPTVTFSVAGLQSAIVTTTTTGGCSASSTTYVIVNALPTITTAATPAVVTAVCRSASVQTTTMAYTASTGNPTSYSIDWDTLTDQGSTSFTFVSGAGSVTGISVPAGTVAGTYTGTMTIINANGCTATKAVTLTVVAVPVGPVITKNPNVTGVCVGSTLTMSVTTAGTGGAVASQDEYRYNTGSGFTAWDIAIPSFAAVAGTNTIESRRTSTGTGCTTAFGNTLSWTVTVNATPSVTIAITSGSNPACSGSSVTFTATPTNGGTPTYQWTKNGTNIGGATSSTYTGVGGTDFVSADIIRCVLIPTAICVSSTTATSTGITLTVTPTVTINHFSPATASRCQTAETLTRTTTANNSTGITYSLDATSIAGGNTIVAATGAVTYTANWVGTTTITARATGCGVDATTTYVVTTTIDSGAISLNAGLPITTGNVSYCPSSVAKFSIDSVPGALNYIWSVPAGWKTDAGVVISSPVTTVAPELNVITGVFSESGSVSVMANNLFCPTNLWVGLTTIVSDPTQGTITNVTCATGGSVVLNGLPSGNWTLERTEGNIVTAPTTGSSTVVTNLAAGSYTFKVRNSIGCLSSPGINVSIPDMPIATWTGTAWVGSPTIDKKIILEADGDMSSYLEGCSCQVKAGANVIVKAGKVLKLQNGLDVDPLGMLTFENGASLVQVNDLAVNTGNIIYDRTALGIKDFDYVYWSSPVLGQTMESFSPSSDKYYSYANSSWVNAGGIMQVGKGYIMRAPRYVTQQNVEFKGVPNNGAVSVAVGDLKNDLIGNPYPSALDAESFIVDSNNSEVINGSLYFWTHNTQRALVGNQYKYIANDYALYNLSGGTAASSTGDLNGDGIPDGIEPSGDIAAGQSFFVACSNGQIQFNNSMRVDEDNKNSQFFKQSNTKKTAKIEKNRVWLNLTNDEGAFKQLLVGYIAGATNDFDKLYDGVSINGNAFVDFYSVGDSKNYTIQGRKVPFEIADEVSLGYNTTIAGTFKINIDKVDGKLVNQAIYLEDKLTNTIHDLKSSPYSFATEIGTFKNRFVLRYTDTSKLGTDDNQIKGKGVIVSVKNSQIKINSFDQMMSAVKIYDLKGSLIYTKDKLNNNEFIINHLLSSNQFLIVMTQLEDGKWVSEEIIFKE